LAWNRARILASGSSHSTRSTWDCRSLDGDPAGARHPAIAGGRRRSPIAGWFLDTGCVLAEYFRYYHRSRPHLALDKQCPIERQIMPHGVIVEIPELGGLHHRYERIAA
jgi:hypothetical protein